jgi:KEOPS complex subunit Cgi121
MADNSILIELTMKVSTEESQIETENKDEGLRMDQENQNIRLLSGRGREGTLDAGECMILQFGIVIEDPAVYLRKVREISQRYGVFIVLFNAEIMAGISHVCSALQHAFRAFHKGTAISNSPEMEALLYASGSRQCQIGMQFGVHPGTNFTYLCICPGNKEALGELLKDGEVIDDDWDFISPEKMERLIELFEITPEEIEVAGCSRIKDLIIERVALLEVYR